MEAAARFKVWPGLIEAYRDRLPVSDATPVITLREGGTPLLPAPYLSERVEANVLLKYEGLNPTGSFKDRGMTVAISKAVEEGLEGGHLRLDRQHVGVGGGLRRPGRPRLRRAHPRRAHRPGQAGPGAHPRRQGDPDQGQLRPGPDRGAGAGRPRRHHARQLGQPLPARRAEDRRLRDRRRVGRRARRPLHPGRQRRQHHRLLAGLRRGPRRRSGGQAAPHARLAGRRGRPAGLRRAGGVPGDDRHRHPHRQPRLVGRRHRRPRRVGRGHRGRHRRRDPRRLPAPGRTGGRVLRAGVGGVGGRAVPGRRRRPDPRRARRWSAP